MAIITPEQFRARAFKEVEIPGFEPGERITVLLRKISIISLASSGKIPNQLMGVVAKLFDGEGRQKKDSNSFENIVEMSKILAIIAEAAMVEPAYSEVKEFLTDDQLNAIFEYSQGVINDVTPNIQK